MAIGTLTRVHQYTEANRRVRVYDVQLTSGANYTTGGETINPSDVGLHRIDMAQTNGIPIASDGSTGRSVGFLYGQGTTGQGVKVVVLTTASAQAASNSDQSGHTVRVSFVGR